MCVNEDGCCRSVNYKKNSLNDEKENCELLHVTPAEEHGLLEVHIDYDHYVLLQPNRVSECYTCIYGITCPEINYPKAHDEKAMQSLPKVSSYLYSAQHLISNLSGNNFGMQISYCIRRNRPRDFFATP